MSPRSKAASKASAPARQASKKASKKAGKEAGKKADAIDGLIAAGAEALALPIDPAWHHRVKFNLQLILRHAALVDEFPLADDSEPAPVFHA